VRRAVLAVCLAAVALCLTAGAATGAGQTKQPAPRTTIRVGLWTLWHDRDLTVTPLSGVTLRLCATCPARPVAAIAVQVEDGALTWTEQGGGGHSSTELLLTGSYRLAAHGESLTLAWPLRITAKAGTLSLVATLPVERYVELVVAAESGAADGPESRKALAVVARSFALQASHGHAGFDVCDSTHCQWVHWRSTPEAHEAALATAGEVLWFRGSRAAAYFHQNCGGRTAAAEEVWPDRAARENGALGHLVSHTDNYCQRAGSSEWSATLTRAELTQALAAAGLAAPGWKSLTVAKRGDSGRATALLIGSAEIPAEGFRLAVGRALGWNQIRSNWFEVAAQGDSFLFHGRGSGHGVGLCQAGAAEMAREGRGYREILTQYFPGATLGEETTGAAWETLNGQGFTLETSEAADASFLPALARALAEAESRSGLTPEAALTVRTYRSTPAFRDATLAPGWVAAFTEGDSIAVQPLRTLAARKLLAGTLLHEFLHALVEERATAQTPLWLREGLVEVWSGDARRELGAPSFCHPERGRRGDRVEGPASCVSGERVGNKLTLEQIEQKLAHATSETESEAAHRAAGWYAQQLLDRYGRAQVLEWLRAGPPQPTLDSLR
jgi:stage II sporulation protein D